MKRKLSWVLGTSLLCGLIATPAYSQKGVGDSEGIARLAVQPKVVSLEGTVAEVLVGKCEKTTGRSVAGAHVLVTTRDGFERNIHLGPADVVRHVTDRLVPGQTITVMAFRTEKLPEHNYVAKSLTIDGASIELRDENLRPKWAGSERGLRSGGGGRNMGNGTAAGGGRGRGPGQCARPGDDGRVGPGQGFGRGGGQGRGQGRGPLAAPVDNRPLSVAIADGLLKLREEEKLAHDVYVALGALWKTPVFANIAQAESRHMDAMARLLDTYSIADPVADSSEGEFSDPEFGKLYDQLVTAGSVSLAEAFKVGALIEEMDIADLRLVQTDAIPPNIERVYQNLERASRNHLRAFAAQLDAQGETYVAMHLTQDEFNAVADAPRERGAAARGGRPGNGPDWGGGKGAGQGGPGRGKGRTGRGAGVAPNDGEGCGGGFGQAPGRRQGNEAGRGRGYGKGPGRGG